MSDGAGTGRPRAENQAHRLDGAMSDGAGTGRPRELPLRDGRDETLAQ